MEPKKKATNSPQLYMIGGPNGAGKTTAAMSLLPNLLLCNEYINADTIAAALSPFAPETTAVQAGKLMLERINYLADQKKDFAFETTMASRTFCSFLNKYKLQGYHISLIFFWLPSSQLAIERVRIRVQDGGHHIPDETVMRRYERSMTNFVKLYIPIADDWVIYDNTLNKPHIVAEKKLGTPIDIVDKNVWHTFEKLS